MGTDRLPQVAMMQSATDPITGAIDMDKILTGVSASERLAQQQLAAEIRALLLREYHPCPPLFSVMCKLTSVIPVSKIAGNVIPQ